MKKNIGRPKGSQNIITAEVRQKFGELIEANISTFQDDLDSLTAYERLTILMQLSKFILPTLKATELTSDLDKVIEISFKD